MVHLGKDSSRVLPPSLEGMHVSSRCKHCGASLRTSSVADAGCIRTPGDATAVVANSTAERKDAPALLAMAAYTGVAPQVDLCLELSLGQ